MANWHYESDGGTTHTPGFTIHTPKIHYVTDGNERIDCASAKLARDLATKLNGASDEEREKLLKALREYETH